MPKSINDEQRPSAFELMEAIETFRRAGMAIMLPDTVEGRRIKVFAVRDVALILDCSTEFIKSHLDEFPEASRMPGGEIRIPLEDIKAALERWRIRQAGRIHAA
jgi:hypothetical protein